MDFDIEVPNWAKYNPRVDYKTQWFRIDNDLFSDPQFAEFEPSDWTVFLYILCITSKKGGARWGLKTRFVARQIPVSEAKISDALTKLQELHIVRCTSTDQIGQVEMTDLSTRKLRSHERNERNETNVTNKDATQSAEHSLATPRQDVGGGVNVLIKTYIDAYRANVRYGPKSKPHIDGKVRGRMQQLLKEVPLDRAVQMVQVYLQMDDQWFQTKCHDWSTFMENLNKVGTALDTGRQVGRATGLDEWAQEEVQ